MVYKRVGGILAALSVMVLCAAGAALGEPTFSYAPGAPQVGGGIDLGVKGDRAPVGGMAPDSVPMPTTGPVSPPIPVPPAALLGVLGLGLVAVARRIRRTRKT